jgi:hypothetical protein
MASKRSKTGSKSKSGAVFTVVSSGLQAFTARLAILGDLRGPKDVREWLILSLSEIGLELGKYARDDGSAFSKGLVSQWESGNRKLNPVIVKAYSDLIASRMTRLIGRPIEIGIEVNSPWRVMAYSQCDCGEWFKMHDAKSRRCPKCTGRRR